jgi:hypothetical protein
VYRHEKRDERWKDMQLNSRRRAVLTLAAVPVGLLAACQAAPTPEKPAAAAPGLSKLFLMVDTVHSTWNLPEEQKPTRSCVLTNRFARNSAVVWRVRVHDPQSGELMDDKALKGVDVALANGATVESKYGPHPKDPPNEFYWTAAWKVPKDHATGTLKYSVAATALDGRTGKFEPFAVAPSLLTITEEILADVPAKPKA